MDSFFVNSPRPIRLADWKSVYGRVRKKFDFFFLETVKLADHVYINNE
jgi:hypothetical protein